MSISKGGEVSLRVEGGCEEVFSREVLRVGEVVFVVGGVGGVVVDGWRVRRLGVEVGLVLVHCLFDRLDLSWICVERCT